MRHPIRIRERSQCGLLNTKSQISIKQPLARPIAFRSGRLSWADFRPSREHAIPPAQIGTFINASIIGETFCSIHPTVLLWPTTKIKTNSVNQMLAVIDRNVRPVRIWARSRTEALSSAKYLSHARKTSQLGISVTAAPKYHATRSIGAFKCICVLAARATDSKKRPSVLAYAFGCSLNKISSELWGRLCIHVNAFN